MTQIQEIINYSIQKFMNGYEGLCINGAKFLKEWQVRDKIIGWIFFQFTFNLLWMTQTQEIINYRLSKIYKWMWGIVYELGKFLKERYVRDKIIG